MRSFFDGVTPGGASGPARSAIFQIHPTLRCNLSCGHCYSSSGPRSHVELDTDAMHEAIRDAAAMGYSVVSVSGGEPLIYAGLDRLLARAKSLGLRTTVTTNGWFAGANWLDRVRDGVDLLAISLDGPPAVHNAMRGSPRAFERLCAGVERLRSERIPFGFIHTVTRDNWEHLLWSAEFAARSGAQLFQIHPLELAGRAAYAMSGERPGADVLAKVYVLASALAASYGDMMSVQVDLLYRDHLRAAPGLVYADEEPTHELAHATPAERLGLIVLAPDGTVVPLCYGVSRNYRLCNVTEQRLVDAWPDYLARGYPEFRRLCRRIWAELSAPDAPLVCNWHEVVVSRSHSGVFDTCGSIAVERSAQFGTRVTRRW